MHAYILPLQYLDKIKLKQDLAQRKIMKYNLYQITLYVVLLRFATITSIEL
jgi:hypothetical protein